MERLSIRDGEPTRSEQQISNSTSTRSSARELPDDQRTRALPTPTPIRQPHSGKHFNTPSKPLAKALAERLQHKEGTPRGPAGGNPSFVPVQIAIVNRTLEHKSRATAWIAQHLLQSCDPEKDPKGRLEEYYEDTITLHLTSRMEFINFDQAVCDSIRLANSSGPTPRRENVAYEYYLSGVKDGQTGYLFQVNQDTWTAVRDAIYEDDIYDVWFHAVAVAGVW